MASYTERDLELIDSATNGEGIKTGDSWNDQFGVAIPHEYARFICSVGESLGIERGSAESNITYYNHGEENNVVRMEQKDVAKVMTTVRDPNLIAALNAYANGASWEESGMSQYNDLILKDSNVSDYDTDQKNSYAEERFWYYYIRNYGDLDSELGLQKYTSTSIATGAELSNYFNPVAVEYERWDEKQNLTTDLKHMLAGQLEFVNPVVGYNTGTEPIEVTDPVDEPDPFQIRSPESYSDYYANQLTTYNTKYEEAITKVTNMITKLTKLYESFNNATGNDITKIRADLTSIINDLTSIKTKITDAKKKTNENAASCQRCYVNWTNKDKYYDVYIDNTDGHVCGTEVIPDPHEYREPGFLESLFIGTARAEGIDQHIFHKATIEEMLNS